MRRDFENISGQGEKSQIRTENVVNLKATFIGKIFVVAACLFLFAGRVFSASYQGPGGWQPPPPPEYPLTVIINGQGTVTPNLNGNLVAGQSYQMIAKPEPGYAFAGWTGDLNQPNSLAVSFTMPSNNMVLVANFVPTPFVTENYHGLIVPLNLRSKKRSGVLDLALTAEGDFTARVQLGIDKFSFSGTFLTNGLIQTWLTSTRGGRNDLGTIVVQLHLDPYGHALTADFGYEQWQAVATTSVYNAKSNPAPQAGQYTLLIPGGEDSSIQPGGDGYVTVSVDQSGRVNVSGKLGDGTPFAQKTFLCVNGQWPIYASLYSGEGYISGWLTFTNTDGSDILGTLNWEKQGSKKGLYPLGFQIQSEVIGSKYDPSDLPFNGGTLMLTNGGLSEPITISGNPSILPQAGSKNQKISGVSLKLSPANGTFSGNVDGFTVNGVILPKQGFGGGFFVGTNETGQVYLGP